MFFHYTNYDNNFEGTSHQMKQHLDCKIKLILLVVIALLINALSINELKRKLTNSLNLHSFRTNSINPNKHYKNMAMLSGSVPQLLLH